MLVILYRMLLDGVAYEERDDAPVSPQRVERFQQRLIEKLESLGLNVTVSVRAQAP